MIVGIWNTESGIWQELRASPDSTGKASVCGVFWRQASKRVALVWNETNIAFYSKFKILDYKFKGVG